MDKRGSETKLGFLGKPGFFTHALISPRQTLRLHEKPCCILVCICYHNIPACTTQNGNRGVRKGIKKANIAKMVENCKNCTTIAPKAGAHFFNIFDPPPPKKNSSRDVFAEKQCFSLHCAPGAQTKAFHYNNIATRGKLFWSASCAMAFWGN